MGEKKSDERENRAQHDRATLKAALCTMKAEQLRALRSTIIRLKHLPFTKLTEVLFAESLTPVENAETTARVREDSPVFAQDFLGHCESETTRNLFEDVEIVLKDKEERAAQ